METYYILRLGKELRNKLICLRKELYGQGANYGVLALEPCIFLGPADANTKIPFVRCPKLPIQVSETPDFQQGHFFVPLLDAPLDELRASLNTNFFYDGIYLGNQMFDCIVQSISITDVSIALLSIHQEGTLVSWHVWSERHLDSGKEWPADTLHS